MREKKSVAAEERERERKKEEKKRKEATDVEEIRHCVIFSVLPCLTKVYPGGSLHFKVRGRCKLH